MGLGAQIIKNLEHPYNVRVKFYPLNDGTLRRLDVTLTGKSQGTIWIGTDSDLMALTVAAGNVGACREFLKSITNASPLLLPIESK